MLRVKFTPGFFFSSLGGNGTTKFVVNVCGHASVGWPLARNMTNIPEDYLDYAGLDNLIIPISVGEPQKLDEDYDYGINVVVHPCLTKRVKKSFPLCHHYIRKLTILSLEWIQKECGVKLVEQTCKLLGIQKSYSLPEKGAGMDSIEKNVMKAAAAAAASLVSEEFSQLRSNLNQPAASPLFSSGKSNSNNVSEPVPPHISEKLQLENPALSSVSPSPDKKGLVKEVIQEKGIKKGFLANANKTLYGEEGTREGSGKQPDPLAHIPESLRKRCLIVDTRNGNTQQEIKRDGAKSDVISKASAWSENGVSSTHRIVENENLERRAPSTMAVPQSASEKVPREEKITVRENNCGLNDQEHYKEKEHSWKYVKMEEKNSKIIVTFQSPEPITSMSDVVLEVTPSAAFLDGEEFPFPISIDADNAEAKFVKSKKKLIITSPVTQ